MPGRTASLGLRRGWTRRLERMDFFSQISHSHPVSFVEPISRPGGFYAESLDRRVTKKEVEKILSSVFDAREITHLSRLDFSRDDQRGFFA